MSRGRKSSSELDEELRGKGLIYFVTEDIEQLKMTLGICGGRIAGRKRHHPYNASSDSLSKHKLYSYRILGSYCGFHLWTCDIWAWSDKWYRKGKGRTVVALG